MKSKLPKQIIFAYIALLIATAIWGGALPVIKVTQGFIPPFTFLLFRFILVCIVMLPIVFIEMKKTPIHSKDIKNLVLLGIFGQGSLALIFLGIKYTSSIDAAILNTIAPLMVIFAAHHFYNEKVNSATKIGILIATIGTLFIVLEPILTDELNKQEVLHRIYGNALVIGYNVCFTIYTLFSKVVMGKTTIQIKSVLRFLHVEQMKKAYSPLLSTAITFYVGLLVTVPLAILENAGAFGEYFFVYSHLTIEPILGILYMAIFSSIVAYIAYEWGINMANVSDGAIFGYLGPLFTIPFSYLLLREIPTNLSIMGAIVIALGVLIAEKNKKILKS